jgi:site-specific recombinase XerD
VLGLIEGVPSLVCRLLYGSGARVNEWLGVRVKDLDSSHIAMDRGKRERLYCEIRSRLARRATDPFTDTGVEFFM